MSHKATLWAIEQRGLKPTTKIVLWHLCDRFNPDFVCFLSQARLAHDCEISRSTLNDHLDRLETTKLLRRVPRVDPVTKRQMPTRYILGFEDSGTPHNPEPCPDSGHGDWPVDVGDDVDTTGDFVDPCPEIAHGIPQKAVSGFCPDPCPENAESRVRNPDTNLVREPISKPVKEEEGAQAREAISDEFFGTLLGALGLNPATLSGWWQGWPPRLHVKRWRDELGMTEEEIVTVAEASSLNHPEPPDGPKALDRAMQRSAQRKSENAGRKRRKPKAARALAAKPITDLPAFHANFVNAGGYGFGLEYVLMQRAALVCKIDGGQPKMGSYTHAKVSAATVAGLPETLGGIRMAIRLAALARAARDQAEPAWRTLSHHCGRHRARAVLRQVAHGRGFRLSGRLAKHPEQIASA